MEKSRIDRYIKRAFPEHWFDYARELRDASLILWRNHSNELIVYLTHDEGNYHRKLYSRTYFLLMGLAIENLFKGLLISENPEYVKDGIIHRDISSGHNILFLSEKVKSLVFSNEEEEICKVLSDVIPYWGKYPIPKNFKQLKSEVFMSEDWFSKLLNLYDKLEIQLYILNYDGIKGPNGINFPKIRIQDLDIKLGRPVVRGSDIEKVLNYKP
ncbi:hypothetical protein [Fibrivirga algicola]|uniref:Uncharacterized protein n=1 Tax=Fibrivirga algicola TaxID=2950420 RepID=A0ABX0QJB9_9BACT|nr:hypothetical protein [Fibrivirga algicola]NID11346.1 hypothetical protein [Fibrivirga algicola]